MIVKKAIVINVKLSPSKSVLGQLPSDQKRSAKNHVAENKSVGNLSGENSLDNSSSTAFSTSSMREKFEQMLKEEEATDEKSKSKGLETEIAPKLGIKLSGLNQSSDGSVKLKLKVTGEVEISEDFAALAEKALTGIFTRQTDNLRPFELLNVNSSG